MRTETVLRRGMQDALRRGDWADATAILERLKLKDPLSRETRGLELDLLLRSGRLAEAEVIAEQLTELFPGSGRIHYLAGQLHYRRKAYTRAEVHFRESVRIHPYDVVRQHLGKTLTQLGRFGEAEALLSALAEAGRDVVMDLAWLYERKQDYPRALRLVEHRLAQHPDDSFAQSQCRRLRAKLVPPDELVGEMETLRELGEDVPEEVLPEFIGDLLRCGQKQKAQKVLDGMDPTPNPRLAVKLGWVCHKLQAYDMSLDLFIRALPENAVNPKFLSAIERAADRCNRLDDLIALYEETAPTSKNLYGRALALKRRAAGRQE